MHGYYDHHPLVTLDRHLVVAGYFGAETRQVGFQLASLTGLGVSDLDRTIEHYAGKSIPAVIWEEGEEYYRLQERRYLERLLAARPWEILSLGDGTLIDPANRMRVLAVADLVILDRDLANCYWWIKRHPPEEGADWHPLYPGALERIEQLRPFQQRRQPGFAQAHLRIDLAGKGRREVVDQLIAFIEGNSGKSPRNTP